MIRLFHKWATKNWLIHPFDLYWDSSQVLRMSQQSTFDKKDNRLHEHSASGKMISLTFAIGLIQEDSDLCQNVYNLVLTQTHNNNFIFKNVFRILFFSAKDENHKYPQRKYVCSFHQTVTGTTWCVVHAYTAGWHNSKLYFLSHKHKTSTFSVKLFF